MTALLLLLSLGQSAHATARAVTEDIIRPAACSVYSTGTVVCPTVQATSKVVFADGTTQTTAASATSFVSTFTNIAIVVTVTGSATAGKLKDCIAGSTLTLITTGLYPTWVFVNGSVGQDSNVNDYNYGFLVDGAFRSPWSASLGVLNNYGGASFDWPLVFHVPIGVLSAGSHKFCLTGGSATAGAIAYFGGKYTGAADSITTFGAREGP